MRAEWMVFTAMAFMLNGCATSPLIPTPEEKQALAPTGKLRIGFQNNNAHATKDPTSGEYRGPAIDFGKELAQRLGVPFQPVPYETVVELVNSVTKGEWDVLSIGMNPERAKTMEFSAPYSQIENGFLVGKDSPISAISEIDRAGIRVAVLERGGSDLFLTKTLKHATLIRVRTFADSIELVKTGKADATAFIKTGLYPASDKIPGSRILEGSIQTVEIGIAVPKGSDISARYIRKFVDELKAQGFVKQSIERSGVRGLMAAP